jgi:hypothetical protein
MNLKQTKPPSSERSFQSPQTPSEPIGIVKKALAKFATIEQYQHIVHGFRRSFNSDEALTEDFFKCNIPKHSIIRDTFYTQALDITTELFRPTQQYRPVHYADLRYYPWTLNTSIEAPFSTDTSLRNRIKEAFLSGLLQSPKLTMHNCYNHVFVYNRPIIHMIKEGKSKGNKFFYWNTAHARSHMVLYDDPSKIRMVFGVPKLLLQVELMLLWPYFNWLRKGSTPLAWSYETLNGGIYKIYTEASSHSYSIQTWLALDWSKFDKYARFELIDDIHQIWSTFMIMDQGYIPTSDYRESQTEAWRIANLWKFMSQAVKFTPIRLPDGSEWTRTHATIPSGLLQTQVLDSWYNAVITITCLLALGYTVTKELFIKILGDDSLVGLIEFIQPENYEDFLDKFATEALQRFGAKLNRKKSSVKNTLQGSNFLGYTFNNAIPVRDELALLAQLAYPERNWDINKLAARAVGICWASCGQSDLVYNVCLDVFNFCVNVANAVPDPQGYSWMEYLMITSSIDPTVFPTKADLTEYLLSPRHDPKSDFKFWNPDHFFSTH